jgi:UDP-N-acetylmuramoyl-tripeptide--D-alanyl-D-alanine ligase
MSVVRALRLAEAAPAPRKTKRSPSKPRSWQNARGMEPRTLQYISIACGGELDEKHGDVLARRVCTDSRKVSAGDLFIALRGDRFDGHDFLKQAAEKGAVAVMVEPCALKQSLPCPQIIVADTRRALGRLAACYRADFDLPIAAVGGSNGKTSTKEILGSILGEKLRALCSEASFNNEVGVPLTLLDLNGGHQAAVLEVATNHPGELAPLVQMIQPRYGIITSIGREHLEFFGDITGVAEEEGWLAELLPVDGKLFINGDNGWASGISSRCRAEVVRVGFSPENDWRVESVKTGKSGIKFSVVGPMAEFNREYEMNLLGRHQALNATLALALSAELGLTAKQCRRGLQKCKPAPMRLQVWEHEGVHVLDDSYNANADSMLVALEALNEFPCTGRRIAVVGEMAELGPHCADAHQEVGRRSAESGVTHLFTVGKAAEATAEAARAAGVEHVNTLKDVNAALGCLKKLLRPGDVVLVKASRAAGLDRITDALGRPSNGAHETAGSARVGR